MSARTVGAVAETAPGERRVALSPDGAARLLTADHQVIVEAGAGDAAWFTDSDYTDAGARLLSRREVYEQADIIVCVHPPPAADVSLLRPGQVLIGLLAPLLDPDLARSLAQAKVTAISLDGLPRTLSAAQSMDVLSSQANVAGYKAALVAADTYGGYLPMFMTAAGTTRPAQVLVIGAGVAGLQAISTARRLGAVVTGYDVREAARADVASTGANFLDLGTPVSATGDGGYARALTADERDAQQGALAAAIATFDIVITTAQVPGRPAAGARLRGRAGRDATRLGGGRPRREWVRRQRRRRTAGNNNSHRQRRHCHRCRKPALPRTQSRLNGLRPQHRCHAGPPRSGRRARAGP